jgi:multidrug resistance efflux pump
MTTPSTRRRTQQTGDTTAAARAERTELALSAESEKWGDRPHYRARPKFRSLLLLLALLALCALIAVTQIRRRLDNRDHLNVTQAVLTVDPIVIEAAGTGRVLEVPVAKGAKVAAGTLLALVEYDSSTGPQQVEITAPADGVVTDVWAVSGVGLLGGTHLVSMYEPSKLYFKIPMTYGDVAKIDIGSTAKFDVPGLGDVDAIVSGVQPDFGEAGTEGEERLAQLTARPKDPAALLGAVPGAIVDGQVNKNSDDPSQPKVLFGAGV